jgi:uncharacterized membrane protein YecN with MAPEG domain
MSISLICVALLAFLCLALGFNVSMARSSSKTLFASDTDPQNALYKARRAHGNTIEYAPVLALLIYILGQSQQPAWVIWSMVMVTFFRYLIVVGILIPHTMAAPNPMRFVGALGTYLGGLALTVAVLIQAIGT